MNWPYEGALIQKEGLKQIEREARAPRNNYFVQLLLLVPGLVLVLESRALYPKCPEHDRRTGPVALLSHQSVARRRPRGRRIWPLEKASGLEASRL